MTPLAIVTLLTEIIKLFRLLIEDMPPERRRQSWERWFKLWDPVFKLCGLDVSLPLLLESEEKEKSPHV